MLTKEQKDKLDALTFRCMTPILVALAAAVYGMRLEILPALIFIFGIGMPAEIIVRRILKRRLFPAA